MERRRSSSYETGFRTRMGLLRTTGALALSVAFGACAPPPPHSTAQGQSSGPGIVAVAHEVTPTPAAAEVNGGGQPNAHTAGVEGLQSTEWVRFGQDGSIWFNIGEFTTDECSFHPEDVPPEVALAIVHHFGTGRLAAEAIVVAWSENHAFDPTQHPQNSDGSHDVGIFQINYESHTDKVGSMDELFDIETNVRVAKQIYEDHKNWSAWYAPRDRNCQNIPQ